MLQEDDNRVTNWTPQPTLKHFVRPRNQAWEPHPPEIRNTQQVTSMLKFLLWCLLFVLCWPLALLALVLYPVVWLLLLPFRLIGIAVGGALELVAALIFLPARLIRAI